MTDERQDPGTRSRGRLDRLGVSRRHFAVALVVAAVLIAGAMLLTGDVRPQGFAIVALPVLVVALAWTLARCFAEVRWRKSPGGFLRTAVIWLIAAEVARRLALMVIVDPSAIGRVERYVLAPALLAAIIAIGARTALTRLTTIAAALVIASGLIGRDTVRSPSRTVSAAGVAQLQRAMRSGETVTMRGEAFSPQRSDTLSPPTASAIGRVAATATCRSTTGRWQHRSALGFPGQSFAYRAEACWDGDAAPVSAELDVSLRSGWDAAPTRPVRFQTLTPFDAASSLGPDAKIFEAGHPLYGDARVKAAPDEVENANGAAIFDRGGRFLGGGRPEDASSTAQLRVSPDGSMVSMVFAVEVRDPLVRGRSEQDGDADVENARQTADRLFELRTRPGYANTTVSIVLGRDGTAHSAGLRSTARGSRRLDVDLSER